ncbi:MAG: hypothetical protein WBB18_19185, partial [Nodosilinea sp.]
VETDSPAAATVSDLDASDLDNTGLDSADSDTSEGVFTGKEAVLEKVEEGLEPPTAIADEE